PLRRDEEAWSSIFQAGRQTSSRMGRPILEDGPGGPFRLSSRGRIIEDMTSSLRDEIGELLRMPENGAGAPSLDAIESTLTHGYAEALALEAERSRIERRLGEVARDAGEVSAHRAAAELVALCERRETA